MSEQIQYRAAEIRSTEGEDGRTIDILVAPYGDTADLGGRQQERYARGVFGEPDKVALKLETGPQHAGPVIGRAIGFKDSDDGLVGTFRVSATQAGDDAIQLASDGAIGASAGFIAGDIDRADDGATVIRSGDLREVTLTGTPAYRQAEVMAIRSTERTKTMPEDQAANAADNGQDAEAPGLLTEDQAQDLVTRAVDQYRRGEAEDATPDPVVTTAGRHEYRSVGEVIVDMNLHHRGKSSEATERLQRSIDAGMVTPDGSALNLETRDGFPNVGNSVGSGVPNNLYIPDLLELLREGRPTADLFEQRDLPQEGNTLQTPAVDVGSSVDYQDGEGTEVSNTRVDAIINDWPKSTLAGGQGMTIQAVRWGNPSYADIVVSDLLSEYTEVLDGFTINGDPTVDTPASDTGFTGILNAGATDVPVGGDHKAAVALVGTAFAAVYAGSRRAPIAAIMASADWGEFLNLVDTDGRPIVTTEAPTNPAGFGDAASIAGTLRGVPVVLDENVPVGNVILGSFRDAILWSESASPAQIALTFPNTLVTDVTVFGFNALSIRRPAAFAIMSGIV